MARAFDKAKRADSNSDYSCAKLHEDCRRRVSMADALGATLIADELECAVSSQTVVGEEGRSWFGATLRKAELECAVLLKFILATKLGIRGRHRVTGEAGSGAFEAVHRLQQ